jgi:hypothetical protein
MWTIRCWSNLHYAGILHRCIPILKKPIWYISERLQVINHWCLKLLKCWQIKLAHYHLSNSFKYNCTLLSVFISFSYTNIKTILIECPVALIRYVTYVFLKYENNVSVGTFMMLVVIEMSTELRENFYNHTWHNQRHHAVWHATNQSFDCN